MTRPRNPAVTRERLFAAALNLLVEADFADITVEDVARTAGVAKGTVFYQFGSKTGLFAALLEHGVDLLAEQLRSAAADRKPADALPAIVGAELEFLHRYPAFARLVVAEMWRTDRAWASALRLLRERLVSVFADVLRRSSATALDPAVAAPAIFGMVVVAALDWLTFHPDRPLEDVQRHVLGLLAVA